VTVGDTVEVEVDVTAADPVPVMEDVWVIVIVLDGVFVRAAGVVVVLVFVTVRV
jgi:hypothetical protein